MQKWGFAMRSYEDGLSDNEKSFFDYKEENLNRERDLNSLAIFICYMIVGLLHIALAILMYLLHDKIEAVHIREKRARLPQDHEKDFHECCKFTYQMKHVDEKHDEHFQAVMPYLPVVEFD